MRTRYIEGSSFGDPSVLQLREETLGHPGPGEILVRHRAVGVNFLDALQRKGGAASTPFRMGLEASGEVLEVGDSVHDFGPGDRIVYAGGPPGSYSDARLFPAGRAVKLPHEVDDASAASIFFKALTADYLVNRLRTISRGDCVLFTAAAGGVGSLTIPLLKAAGAVVIGTVGNPDKIEHARSNGCDHILVLPRDEHTMIAQVRDWTDGKGVAVAYDSIGKATFDLSMASLARFGLLVSFGWASGEVDPVPLSRMREQGSIFLTRPTVSHYTDARSDLVEGASRVFEALKAGVIRSTIFRRLPLEKAGEAQALLESGANSGSIVLEIP